MESETGSKPAEEVSPGEKNAAEQVEAIARELSAVGYRLRGVIASLPEATAMEEPAEVAALRSVAECVLHDYIEPAVRDLLRIRGEGTN